MVEPLEVPRFESDGTISWLPVDGETLTSLEIRKRGEDGEWIHTLHSHPAEIYRRGSQFYIRKPKKGGETWHTVVIDTTEMPCRIEEIESETGLTVVLTLLNYDQADTPEEEEAEHGEG